MELIDWSLGAIEKFLPQRGLPGEPSPAALMGRSLWTFLSEEAAVDLAYIIRCLIVGFLIIGLRSALNYPNIDKTADSIVPSRCLRKF